MAPVRVVPAFQPGEDRHACLGPALEASTVDDFTLQCREEAFGQGTELRYEASAARTVESGISSRLGPHVTDSTFPSVTTTRPKPSLNHKLNFVPKALTSDIAWKLCTNMMADDVTATLKLALEASG